MRRSRFRLLARALALADDDRIDVELRRAGLTRVDLFTPRGALARHRVRMAYMLAARDIDVRRAVETHWADLKAADRICAACAATARCRNWLESAGRGTTPPIFCPNVRLLEALAAEQGRAGARGESRQGS